MTTNDEPRTVTLAELTSRLGLPDHDMSSVLAWTGAGTDPRHTWTESEAAELIAAWRVDEARILIEDVKPAPLVRDWPRPYPTIEPARGEPTGAVTFDVLLSAVRACERDLGRARWLRSSEHTVTRVLTENLSELDARLSRARTLAAAGASGADVLRVLDGIEPTSLPAGVTIRSARDFDDIRTDQEG